VHPRKKTKNKILQGEILKEFFAGGKAKLPYFASG
jgi:hypothetical protein